MRRGKQIALAIGALAWGCFGTLSSIYLGEKALHLFISTTASITIFLLVESRMSAVTRYYDIVRHVGSSYRQLEALHSLLALIKLRAPLPPMRGFAASPDLLRLIADEIMMKCPKMVLEVGSGVSTLMIAYFLDRLGEGKIVSLEHEQEYADKTRDLLAKHDLENVAEVIWAPLKPHEIDGQTWPWYDRNALAGSRDIELGKVDLLVIDGPPVTTGKLARYPALPLLRSHLSEDVSIILDDAIRDDEREIVKRWCKMFPQFDQEYIALEKGAFVLRRFRDN